MRAAIRIPPRRIRRLGEADARAMLDLAREAMVTRSRDLYTFTAANLGDACLVDCGDGLEFFCIGVEPEQRLLLDAVYGLLTLRNGVPIGYALFSALWRSSEVAYNVFETFRGGESAWVYGRCSPPSTRCAAPNVHDRSVPARAREPRGPRVRRVVVLLQARVPAAGSRGGGAGRPRGRSRPPETWLPHKLGDAARTGARESLPGGGPSRRDVIGAIPVECDRPEGDARDGRALRFRSRVGDGGDSQTTRRGAWAAWRGGGCPRERACSGSAGRRLSR